MRRHVRLAALIFAAFIFTAALMVSPSAPAPALAQTCTGDASSFGVYPPTAAAGSTIAVTTANATYNFAPGDYAYLVGWGTLTSTVTSATTLAVDIPAGLASGTYTLEINYPGGPSCVPLQVAIVGPTPTPTGTPFIRPIVTVLSYTSSVGVLYPGMEFDINMTVQNTGALTARTVTLAVGQGDVVPRG